MQATKTQVLAALFLGLVLSVGGVWSAVVMTRTESMDQVFGFGMLSVAALIIGGMFLRAAVLEIMDAVRS